MVKIQGYELPPQVREDGSVLNWLQEKLRKDLKCLEKMDIGDRLAGNSSHKNEKMDVARDHRLGRIEIFQGILLEYDRWTRLSVEAGLAKNWGEWEKAMARKDQLAAMVQELGWEPVFHTGDRDYHRRIVALLEQSGTLRDLKGLQALYRRALGSWSQGGLCLKWTKASLQESTLEQSVQACKSPASPQEGRCTDAMRKVMTLMASALAVYRGAKPKLSVVSVSRVPSTGNGHIFLSLDQGGIRLALDPGGVGFRFSAEIYETARDPWRRALSVYYANRGTEKFQKNDKTYLSDLDAALVIDIEDGFPWLKIGQVLLAEGMRDGETILLHLSRDRHWPEAAMSLGVFSSEHKNYEAAEGYFREALRLDPSFLEAFFALKNVMQEKAAAPSFDLSVGNFAALDQDYQFFRSSLTALPKKAEFYRSFGLSLDEQLDKINLKPDSPDRNRNMNRYFAHLIAIELTFRESLRLNSRDLASWLVLAESLSLQTIALYHAGWKKESLRKRQEAITVCGQALARNPENKVVSRILAGMRALP